MPGTVVWCTPPPMQAWSGRTAAVGVGGGGGDVGNRVVVVPRVSPGVASVSHNYCTLSRVCGLRAAYNLFHSYQQSNVCNIHVDYKQFRDKTVDRC